MKKIDITKFRPCLEGINYYKGQTSSKAAWENCPRGDWMLWIAYELGVDDGTLTKARALCAGTARHLMKDPRSIAALKAAIDYADGKISREALKDCAYAAHYTARSRVAIYAADAAWCAAYAVSACACAAAASNAARAAACAEDDDFSACVAERANLLQTARICREVLTKAVYKKSGN
jgi:hypothetical protein